MRRERTFHPESKRTRELERLIDAIASRSIPAGLPDNGYPPDKYPKDYDLKEQKRVREAVWALSQDASNDLWSRLVSHFDDKRLSILVTFVGQENTVVSRWSVGEICQRVARGKAICAYLQHLPPLRTEQLGALQISPQSNDVLCEFSQHRLHRPQPLDVTTYRAWCQGRKAKPLYEIQVELCEWAVKGVETDFSDGREPINVSPEKAKKEFLTAVKREIESLRKTKKPVVDHTPFASPVSEENCRER